MKKKFKDIEGRIKKGKNIIITSHVNPDGDAIGAGLSLYLALEKLDIFESVRFILDDKVPENINFLSRIDSVERYDRKKSYEFDLMICVDAANIDRIGEIKELRKDKDLINIDHHISNDHYGEYNCVEEISSTSELIYNFINYLDIEIDLSIGEGLYLGLVNDTGNFSHSNVSEDTMEMARDLIGIGVDNNKVVGEFLKSKSLESLKVLGVALSNMGYNPQKKYNYSFISKDELTNIGAKSEDTEGVVELLTTYKDGEITLFIKEVEYGIIKGSLRSKKDVDVNKIASIFGGGGHKKAAGFRVEGIKPMDIIKKIEDLI